MALVRYTQGYLFNPTAKTLDLSRIYPNFDPNRVRQIRQDNDGKLLYALGSATATATFANGVVTFVGVDTTKMKPGDPISILYDEPDNDSPFGGAVAMVANTATAIGRAVWVVATTAGTITLTLSDGSTITVPVAVGLTTLPVAATKYTFTGAAGTVYNML